LALSSNLRDLEKDKFEDLSGITAVRVYGYGGVAYSKRVDEVGLVIYVGESAIGSPESGAVWRIQKITQIGSVLEILWANGSSEFNNIWDDRISLSYS